MGGTGDLIRQTASNSVVRLGQERGFQGTTAFDTTVTSVRRHSGLSINREPFDFRRAQGRKGISPTQRREAMVPSASGDQGAAADDELWLDRDSLRLRDAVLSPEAQSVRQGESLACGGERRSGGW